MREYRYMQAVGGGITHDQYLDLPEGHIEAMIRVHSAYKEAESAQAKGASPAQMGPGRPPEVPRLG